MFRTMAVLAAAVALAVAGASAATAATAAPAAPAQGSTDEATFLAFINPAQTSTIQARLTVPAVNCTSSAGIEDATALVNALSGLGLTHRAQARTGPGKVAVRGLLISRADVMASCATGSAVYQALALGMPLAMTVSPGDKVLLTASFDPSAQQRTATVDDLTTGVALTQTSQDKGGFQPLTDFAGVQRVKRNPVPDFGTIHWSGVQINGTPVSSASFLIRFNLIASIAHPRLLIRTSPLSRAGDAFTNTWVTGS
jgi:hypothetical protein